jgi:hypothetical protein
MMFHDPTAPLFDEDDPWDDFELRTTDHRRLEVSSNRDTGEYFTVERPTVRGPPTPGRP